MKQRFLVLLSVGAALLASCGSQQNAQKNAIPEYQCEVMDTTSAMTYIDLAAELRGEVVVDIRPRVSGYIDKICIAEGTKVTKGQALFEIDSRELRQSLAAAKANVDASKASVANAELEVRKLTPLVEKGIISAFELDNAKTNLASAKAGLNYALSQENNAKINLSYATITAPVSGVVGRIVVRQGTLVSSSTQDPLTTVSADETVSAYFSLNEQVILQLSDSLQGRSLADKISKLPEVSLILSNGQPYELPGKLSLASGQVDMSTGSVQMKATFPNPKGQLRSGASGSVRLNSHTSGVMLVPQKAAFETLDKTLVYVLNPADSSLTAVALTISGQTDGKYVVTGGLKKDQIVLLEGIDFVKEGSKIKALYNKK